MVDVYTDGAYASSTDTGGYAFIVVENDEKIFHDCGGVKETTNNRMELLAIIEATKWLREHEIKEACIITDSMYCIGCLTKGWKRKKNVDMWAIMDELGFNYDIKHVKGHSGNKFNEICDMWAVHGSHLII